MKQGQGFVRFVFFSMLFISIYYLSFTIVNMKFETAEQAYADKMLSTLPKGLSSDSISFMNQEFKKRFRDSFQNKPFLDLGIFEYNYKNITKNKLNLGLDLKGGMSFVLEVNEEKLLRSLSGKATHPTFEQALTLATQAQRNSQTSYINLFLANLQKVDPNFKIASLFASNPLLKDKISTSDDNAKVMEILKPSIEASIQNTYNVIKQRVDQYGVAESSVSLQEGSNRIIVELPGADDLERVKKMLESSAKLEFWFTYDNLEIAKSLEAANEALRIIETSNKPNQANDNPKSDSTQNSKDSSDIDDILSTSATKSNAKTDTSNLTSETNPLYEVFTPSVDQKTNNYAPGPIVGYVNKKDLNKAMELFNRDEVKNKFRGDVVFAYSYKPVDDEGRFYQVFALKKYNDGPALAGNVVTNARKETDQFNKPSIGMEMNSQGAAQWEMITEMASKDPRGKQSIAIVMDGVVYSSPTVNDKISGGRSQITGSFTPEEANDLSNILNSGKIDASVKVVQEEVVGPSLGAATIKSGILALFVGLISIFVYMFVMYRQAGIVTQIALAFNLVFLLGVLASIKATLSLPGIAGIVLIIGAAVDANVIIYERIKEELRLGKGIWEAIKLGYQHSFSTIFDANMTTLITSLTLMFFGYGPIRGFAYTLTFGILTSIFTAVFVTREIYNLYQDRGKSFSINTNTFIDKWFLNSSFQFVANRKKAYIFIASFIIVGLISIVVRGFDFGVEFKGGKSFVLGFDQDVDYVAVKKSLDKSLDGKTIVKSFGSASNLQVTTAYLQDDMTKSQNQSDSIVLQKVYESTQAFFKNKPTFEQFIKSSVSNSRKIGASIADDISRSSRNVTMIALVLIFLYITIRFRKWQFAAGAIIALLHDTLFTLGVLSLFKDIMPFSLEINQSIVAAILTIIGFSTNDTVVIFDRIREYMNLKPNQSLDLTINDAINNTLSRTLMTASTLFLVSLVLFVFGGESIRGFSFTMLIGIFVGTLSSIFIAAPIALDLIKITEKK
jgi:SecD/SecF fusion protein